MELSPHGWTTTNQTKTTKDDWGRRGNKYIYKMAWGGNSVC